MELELEYLSFKRCILNDYPYEVEWDDEKFMPIFYDVFQNILEDHSHIDNRYYSIDGKGILRQDFLDHFIILSYRYANKLWKNGFSKQADVVYYCQRTRGNIDLFYSAEIGRYFIPVHALGSVVDSHSTYGDAFSIYNGCHIGPYDILGKSPSEWDHPVIGDNVTMLANSHVYGNSVIGNNVVISVGTIIINKNVPNNSVVMGVSPKLFIFPNTFGPINAIKL